MSTLPRRLKRAISSERKNDVRAATTPLRRKPIEPDSELLDLLFDFQTDRLDDQRCSWPVKDACSASMARRVDAILKKDGPRPMILLPSEGFRCHGWSPTDEEKEKDKNSIECKIQSDEMLMNYRRHFLNKDHENFYCLDDYLGPLLMSLRRVLANQQPSKSMRSWEEYRVIARTRQDTFWQIIPTSEFPSEDPRYCQICFKGVTRGANASRYGRRGSG
ncbi:rap1 GTPase-activating protein 1-like [Oscarella lobularis]|uniref:rap1 GTPase-activating protein 1-like n=2 Tax=Oscarella lobularis TaxID=121494 RepID=UPI003313E74A